MVIVLGLEATLGRPVRKPRLARNESEGEVDRRTRRRIRGAALRECRISDWLERTGRERTEDVNT